MASNCSRHLFVTGTATRGPLRALRFLTAGIRRKTILLALGIAFISLADSKAPFEGLDSFAQQVLTDWKCAGFAIAIIQDGKVTYAKGYGLRDIKTNLPVTTKTLFAIGSSTSRSP